MIAFSQAELAARPRLWIGDEITCPHCAEQHIAFGGHDPQTGMEIDNALFYQCGDGVYLAAIGGREVTHLALATKVSL